MNRKVSVAPMMDCTDRHERFFLRLISKNSLLYTEMIVDEAIHRGDKKKLLEFKINEKPVALQLGGSSPKLLAEASKVGEEFGYYEINLNARHIDGYKNQRPVTGLGLSYGYKNTLQSRISFVKLSIVMPARIAMSIQLLPSAVISTCFSCALSAGPIHLGV